MHPVGCRRAAVEQPGGGEREGAGADGGDPGTTVGGRAQSLEQRRRRVVLGVGAGGNDHRVRLDQLIEPEGTVEEQPLSSADGTVLDCAQLHVVPPGHREVIPGPEDLARNRQLEQRHARGDGDGNSMHGSNLP